jgi:hypothetical protein
MTSGFGDAPSRQTAPPVHVLADSIEIGDFCAKGDCLTTSLRLVLCDRTEVLVLYVEPRSDEIGVEVYEAILDAQSLTVVGERVAAKLDTAVGRAALAQAVSGQPCERRRGPQVRIRLSDP